MKGEIRVQAVQRLSYASLQLHPEARGLHSSIIHYFTVSEMMPEIRYLASLSGFIDWETFPVPDSRFLGNDVEAGAVTDVATAAGSRHLCCLPRARRCT